MKYLRQRGFTFFELTITLVLVSIIVIGANINWLDIIEKNDIETQSNKIVAALQFARSEAITRGQSITFCQSDNQQNCGTNGDDWSSGQIILAAPSQVIRAFPALPNTDILIWRSSFGRNNAITFTPFGTTSGEQGSFQYYRKNNPKKSYSIIIEQTGRVRIHYNN